MEEHSASPTRTRVRGYCTTCRGKHDLRDETNLEAYCTNCGALVQVRNKPRPSDRKAWELAEFDQEILLTSDVFDEVAEILGYINDQA